MAVRPPVDLESDGDGSLASRTQSPPSLSTANRYRLYAEDSPDCMLMAAGTGKLVAMNANARALFGVSKDEVDGLDLAALGAGNFDSRFGEVRQLGRARFEALFHLRKGSAFSAVMNLAKVAGDLYQLVLTEISAPQGAPGNFERAGRRADDRFEYAATPLLEVDFSALRLSMDLLRSSGVRDLKAHFSEKPKALEDGAELVGIVNLNAALCRLLRIDTKFDYLGRTLSELRGFPVGILVESLVCLLEGEEDCEREMSLNETPLGPCLVKARPTLEPGESGSFARALFTFVDFSELSRLREKFETELARSALRVKELEHRVKNHLNMLSSILDLQAQSLENRECAGHLLAARARVSSIAMVYQLLSGSAEGSTLDCRAYIEELVELFREAYQLEERNIRVSARLVEQALDANRVVAIGLIVNELFMNSLKHAFPGNFAGEIRIDMEKTGTSLHFTIGDNGVGVPECFDWRDGAGLGFQLVDVLAQQLKASTRISCEHGFAFTFEVALDP